jgi:hypothetical protein
MQKVTNLAEYKKAKDLKKEKELQQQIPIGSPVFPFSLVKLEDLKNTFVKEDQFLLEGNNDEIPDDVA